MTNPFETITLNAGNTQRSLNWYQSQIKSLKGITPNKLMANAPDLVNSILPGYMYMFFYDAKLKDSLPYWDRFPLVLPFKKVNEGFYGINLHYVTYGVRFKLLGYLTELTSKQVNEDVRLKLNWSFLNSASNLAPVKACVKQYLSSHVESRFLKIKSSDWVTASQLPVERFVGASKTKVWQESRKKF